MSERWNRFKGFEVEHRAVRPGIFRLNGGGFLVRVVVTNSQTGKRKEGLEVHRDATTIQEAQRRRDDLQARVRAAAAGSRSTIPLFSSYAVDLFERKVQGGRIRSKSGETKWRGILLHHLCVAPFAMMPVDEIRRLDLEAWFNAYAPMVKAGKLHPRTANTRLAVLKVIVRSYVATYELDKDPALGIEPLPEDVRPTYTHEEPNSLTDREAREFLRLMRELYPQHYAMVLLGFMTGLRPSHFRPLRRGGNTPDVLWDEATILVRRSHSESQVIMETTKTGKHQTICLPDEVMQVLRWHVDTQLVHEEQRKSELLFPSEVGGLRYGSVLDKPFAAVCAKMGLKKHLTPRGMRRTFQDLCRRAEVTDIVTRSISGHATEDMQRHYSTVSPEEQRESLARVISLLDHKAARAPSTTATDVGTTATDVGHAEPAKGSA